MESDASDRSDRAIAKELGVSQPFVSALRRVADARMATRPEAACDDEMNPGTRRPRPCDDNELVAGDVPIEPPGHTSTAQEALDRFHDQHSPLGRVRRVGWPDYDENTRTMTEWDPFA